VAPVPFLPYCAEHHDHRCRRSRSSQHQWVLDPRCRQDCRCTRQRGQRTRDQC
jgi:hypothetical protein